jgi:hypothetical protein
MTKVCILLDLVIISCLFFASSQPVCGNTLIIKSAFFTVILLPRFRTFNLHQNKKPENERFQANDFF